MSRSRQSRLAAACLAVAALVGVAAHAERRPAASGSGAVTRDVTRVVPSPVAGVASRDAALDDAGYLVLADRLSARLAALWNPRLQRYDPGPGATTSQINADLLLVHATAARRGHRGPARNDARARAAARFLTGPRIWRQGRARPGWRASPDVGDLHPVFQAEVAEALAAAYRARRVLGLDAATSRAIERQLARVIASPAWRWPALLLNQFNWYATIAAADATVNGDDRTLTSGLQRHLDRFAGRAHENFGPGLRFRYDPRWTRSALNFDSAEYANIVLGFSRSYGQAREAGMRRPASLGLLRQWVRRALAGYWTHAGYLNWDTGLGYLRWHQRKKVGLAQGALIGIAAEPELQPSPRWGAWAKWMLDRGLREYLALVERDDRFPAALAYGVRSVPEPQRMARLTAARYAANAMRALDAGLGERPASEPPPLYSFDPDTGRLAVTTPVYNTAIVAANGGAHPYGGLDLARLFDAHQEVAANIGGTHNNAFGLRVGSLRTQYGARRAAPTLELVRAPWGVGAKGGRRAYAGPFEDLRVRGSVVAGGLRARVEYRFTAVAIEGRWSVSGSGGRATVTFPSWGRAATVTATLRDGSRVAVTRHALSLRRVRSLHVRSARSGYTLVPRGEGQVRLITTRREGSQPLPGPTVAISLGTAPARFGVRIVVDRR